MLLWINGPFGAGKTAVATSLVGGASGLRLFDPEWVGYMLRANLPDIPHHDFQDLAPWRALVPRVAAEIASLTGDTLVAVQSVLSETYWQEIASGLAHEGLRPAMVLLDCDPAELTRRIKADEVEDQAAAWRMDHIAAYVEARPWLMDEAQLVVDTTDLTIPEVAARVEAAVRSGLLGR